METQVNEPSGESQDAGLLDSVSVTEDQGQQASPSSTDIEHREEQDDDTPLERPDWWPENFWKKDDSSPDLEGIAKSWQDLRKQIAQGKHKPPADGKYDTSAFGDIPEDDPVRGHVMGWAKEYGISQAALDKLVGDVVAMNGEQAQQVSRTIEEERKALGPNADAIIKGMGDWGAGLVRKGILSKDDFEEFKVMGGTAAGVRVFMKIRETYEGMKIPLQSAPVEGSASKDELYAMVADPKYKTDPGYRSKVERMFASTFGN
jgi:hypothetical protein